MCVFVCVSEHVNPLLARQLVNIYVFVALVTFFTPPGVGVEMQYIGVAPLWKQENQRLAVRLTFAVYFVQF